MTEETGQERTEQATQKRRQDAKKKGQVARSKDLNTAVILLVSGGCLYSFGHYFSRDIVLMLKDGLTLSREQLMANDAMTLSLMNGTLLGLKFFIPIAVCLIVATILSSVSLGGWVFSSEAFRPKFERLSILKGFKRMFSFRGLVDLGKSFGKCSIVLAVLISVAWNYLEQYLHLSSLPFQSAITEGFGLVCTAFMLISSGLIIIAAIDVPYQIWEQQSQLKMTKQEIRDEYKESEGKPEVKSAIRRAQYEISRRRMMETVPEADVVIVNPSHYAVAIKYDQTIGSAPKVIAKGKDQIALRIKELAKEHHVPVLETPPLARAIYFSTKLNQEIPHELYVAMAHVLAYVYQLKKSGLYEIKEIPKHIQNLEIPPAFER